MFHRPQGVLVRCKDYWIAVKELSLSYSIGEAIFIARYAHHSNLNLNPKP